MQVKGKNGKINAAAVGSWMVLLAGVAAAPAPAWAAGKAAPDPAVETTKESERAPLRELQIFPKGPKGEKPDLNDVILDWTADGHVRAARVASAKRTMKASEPGTTSLDPFKGLTQLEKIELLGVAVEDLSPLAKLPALQTVHLQGCLKLKSLAPLGDMPSLTKVRIDRATPAEAVALSGLANLTQVELAGGSVTDASFAAKMTQLEHLDLSGNKALIDIAALSELKGLRYLDLTGTGVKTLDALTGHEALRVLRVSKKANLTAVLPLKAGGLRIEVK